MIIINSILMLISVIAVGVIFAHMGFAITKKLFKKRTVSYTISGVVAFVIYCYCLFNKEVAEEMSTDLEGNKIIFKILIIISMVITVLTSIAFVIGEKRALASGKHTGDFEKDRGARKFNIFSIVKTFKKFRYPLMKSLMSVKDIDIDSIPDFFEETKKSLREEKAKLYIVHLICMVCWYTLVMVFWFYYAMIYSIYWMFAALIDTFIELYTHEGSKFSFKAAVSEIANSEELANGTSAIKNSMQSVVSEAGSAISGISQKASSAISEHKKEKQDKKIIEIQDIQNENFIQISPDTDNDTASDFKDITTDNNIQSVSNYEYKNISKNTIKEFQQASFGSDTKNDFINKQTENPETIISPAPVQNYEQNPVPDSITPNQNKNPVQISSDTDNDMVSDFKDITTDNNIQSVSNYEYENTSKSIIKEIQKASFDSDTKSDFINKHTENPETVISPAPVQNYEQNPVPDSITPNQNKNHVHTLPASDKILPHNQSYVTQNTKINSVLIIVIVILVLIIGMLGGVFFMMSRNKKSDEFDKNAGVSDVKKITDNENHNKKTENVIAEVTPENVAGKAAGASVNISCSKDNVNQIYASIVKNMDFPMPNRGFILDLNNDGINEMIITNTADMNFVMYYFDGNSIQSCSFGNFMAVDNFVIYQVDGEENKNYIYYRDNYSYKSLQGYYSFPSADELNIFIDYPENNGKYSADWTIDYNKTENYAKGNESTDTFYGQVPDCHDKLLSAFKNYGFEIDENSKYTEINGLYYDELIKALTPDSKSDSESKPSVKADVQVRNDEFHMANLYLCVSGDYSYYEYEMYIDGTVSKTGKTSDSEVWLGRASGEFELKIYVTPYNSSGVAGETVIYPNENTTPDGKSDSKPKSSANAYIELRDKITKDASSGFTKWHRASGADFYLHVNGDYSYYKYEYYTTDPYGSNSKLEKTDRTSNSEVYLTSGSGGFGITVYVTPYSSSDIAGETVICTLDENIERTFEPFTIEIVNSYLGYYSGPGHDYEINGHITDHGTYTIIDESSGWGKLKSGEGWIYLDDASNESPLSHKAAETLYEEEKKNNEDIQSNSVEVYSCNYLGEINTCGSTYINGYATSYIVDGGSSSCVRTDLMNDWHVTAVNMCTVNGITWYELYDSDDGDYYGWVDSSHIDLY